MKIVRKIWIAFCALCLSSITAVSSVVGFFGVADGERGIAAVEQDAEALLNDDGAKVTVGKSQALPQIQDATWTEIVQASQPLTVGETYVEDWSRSAPQTRLKPYEIITIPDEEPGATYEYVATSVGKSVKVTTNGAVGGQFDYIKFAGMRYTEDALYTVVIDYTVLTPNRTWKVGFEHNYFMDLSSGEVGEQKQAIGEFSATSKAGYNNNLNYSLLFMINGGIDSAQLQIDKITITRLQDRPSVKNAKISGVYAVGGTLNLTYDVLVGEGINVTDTDINWFITTNREGTDMTVLNEYDGETSIIIPSEADGKYIGCILKPYSSAIGTSGVGENHILLGKAVGETTNFSTFKFQKAGDTYKETFDSLDGNYNVGIQADEGVDAFATAENAINGKSLYIQNKTTEMKGGYLTGMKFTGATPYSVSFKLKLLEKPTELYVQFRALSTLGYAGDVKYQVISPTMTEGNTYECYIPAIKLFDASDYQMQIFSVGKCTILIDDLTLKMVGNSQEIDTLKTPGGTMTEDFDGKNMLTNIDTFGWGGVTFNTQFDGYGLVIESKTSGATTLYFNDFIGKLSAGTTYHVSFDYMVKTDNMPKELYVGVRSQEDGYQNNVRLDFTNRKKDQKYTWSGSFTLADKEDMFLQIFNMSGDGSKIVIDNITVTNATPTDMQKLPDLNVVGSKLIHNFDDETVLGNFATSAASNSLITKENAIDGKSLVLDNTNSAPCVAFLQNNKVAMSGKYKVTFDYKLLTDTLPDYFCVGFHNGKATNNQVNKENWFSGRTDIKGKTYQFEYTFELADAEYYFQIFNLNANGSKIVIDNIVIEKIA